MHLRFALFLIASSVFGVAPVITPGTIPTVKVGTTQQFTANQSVTWSLKAGSVGSINSSTGLYTAPASFAANHNFAGCPALPNDHVLNTRIDALPVNSGLTTYLQAGTTTYVNFEVAFPENIYTNSTPTTSMNLFYTPLNNASFPILPFPYTGVENGIFTAQVDQHILGVNRQSCQFSEIYNAYNVGYHTIANGYSENCPLCNAQSGFKYSNDYVQPPNGTSDAAGLPIIPLTLSYSELAACAAGGPPIKHAMRMTLANGYMTGSAVWPATAFVNNPGMIPYGTRMRLKSSFNITGFSAGAQCVLLAMQRYGMIVADGGSTLHIQTMTDAAGDYALFTVLLREIAAGLIDQTKLEIIDESSLEDLVSTSPAYQTGRVDPNNIYVVPANFATVIATNGSSESSTMPVILQPVTAGTDRAVGYSFMAGAPATQLSVWVNGSSTTTFTCSMSPSLGTLTSGCLYTPPSTSTTRQSTTITVTPTADSSQAISFPLWVYPHGGIREHMANTANTNYGPDASGNTWFADAGSFTRLPGAAFCDFPSGGSNPWNLSIPDIALYFTCEYDQNDVKYRFVVPNGTYQITLLYGIGGTSPFSANFLTEGIDSQGVIYAGSGATTMTGGGPWTFLGLTGKFIDVCNIVGSCANVTPAQVVLNATVTDNNLIFAIRHMQPVGAGTQFNVLTGFSVIPTGAPSTTGTIISGAVTITGRTVIH